MGILKVVLSLAAGLAVYSGGLSAQAVFERMSPNDFVNKGNITSAQASRILKATGLVSCNGKGNGTAIVVGPRTLLTVSHIVPDGASVGSNGICTFLLHGSKKFVNAGLVAVSKLPWDLQQTLNGQDWSVLVTHEDIKGAQPIPLLERAITAGDFDDITKTEYVHVAYHMDLAGSNLYEPKISMSRCRLPDIDYRDDTFVFWGDCYATKYASGSGLYRVDGDNIHLVAMQTGASTARTPTDQYIRSYLITVFSPIGKEIYSAVSKVLGR